MRKSNKHTALEQYIKNLSSNIKTADKLEDLTRLLRKTTLKAMLEGELEDHLGYPKHAAKAITTATAAMVSAVRP